jgi:uncharacterized protein
MSVTVLAVLAIFAVVQSLFGVGLLVFGTPTLLLLGYPFPDTLAIVLPASLAVSVLQIWNGPRLETQFALHFASWCLIPLTVCLAVVLTLNLKTSLNLVVAVVLTGFVGLRAKRALSEWARRWVSAHERTWLLLMGVVHGLSNLGGGLLTILAASRHEEKEKIRALVALCYTCFAVIQLGVLAAFSPGVFHWMQLAYASLSALMFIGIGQRIFLWISAPVFGHLFTALMACYAALLALRVAGLL